MGIFSSKPTYDPDHDIPDLTGKVALVSGGNGGIGFETVRALVMHGAKVYMGARNESRATGAIARLEAEGALSGPNAGKVIWLPLDLVTPESTKRGAGEFLSRETRLDILINNAALGGHPDYFKPVDGDVPISILMSTNHLGPFVLTMTLLPLLKKTAAEPGSDVRIVTVASAAHGQLRMNIDWKQVDQWNWKSEGLIHNVRAYGTTKLANMLFAKELQRRLDAEGVNIVSISLHPGAIRTEGVRTSLGAFWLGYFFQLIIRTITPAQGAYTTLFAATSDKVQAERRNYAGKYLVPFGKLEEPSMEARDPIAARELWETSERVVNEMLQ